MAEKKITKRERYEQIKALVKDNAELVEFCDHEIELLVKKNSAEKKPTANQVANEGIKATILASLVESGKAMQIADISKSNEALKDLANQKISALLRQLVAEGKVERTEDKRKAYFKAV